MTQNLSEKITSSYSSFTKSEKVLGEYFIENLHELPFETLNTIAQSCQVSDMTVGRFVRSLGYKNLNELKSALREQANATHLELDDISKRRVDYFTDEIGLRSSLEKEIKKICDVYALCETEIWGEVVHLIAHRRHVQVIGFQAAMGLALDFATTLKYIRPGVRYLDERSDVFLDLFELDPEQTCLIVVDTARYSEKGRRLIALATEKNYPVVFVSDKYSARGLDYTKYLLRASSEVGTFWDSRTAISAIINLLQHFVANELGKHPAKRMELSKKLNASIQAFYD